MCALHCKVTEPQNAAVVAKGRSRGKVAPRRDGFGLQPVTSSGGKGHPFYNLIQLCKLLNVFLVIDSLFHLISFQLFCWNNPTQPNLLCFSTTNQQSEIMNHHEIKTNVCVTTPTTCKQIRLWTWIWVIFCANLMKALTCDGFRLFCF